jgi:hypothetical protein
MEHYMKQAEDTSTIDMFEEKPTMNGYIAFYRGKQVEVYAATSYEAQQKAAAVFKARKSYEVTVMLAEKDGQQVVHSTGGL